MANDKQLVRDALLKRAAGYEYDEKSVVLDRSGQATGRVKVTKKHVPPDMGAIKVIMRMMKTGEWEQRG